MDLIELRNQAKELGVKGYHLMREKTLIKKISEKTLIESAAEIKTISKKERTGWLYHKTINPRIFLAGEEVPEGWNEENLRFWTINGIGQWSNVNG